MVIITIVHEATRFVSPQLEQSDSDLHSLDRCTANGSFDWDRFMEFRLGTYRGVFDIANSNTFLALFANPSTPSILLQTIILITLICSLILLLPTAILVAIEEDARTSHTSCGMV